jgi:hypothetical protein
MKRILVLALVILISTTASFGRKKVAEGKSNTALGNYKIELADNPVTLKGQDCKTYVISYENTPMEVTVVICKDKNCKRYLVISDKLSVQYVCNKDYFGVEKIGKNFEAEGYKTSDSSLNRAEYFHQKVLAPGQGDELSRTQLIASYFPMLLNETSDIVAIR